MSTLKTWTEMISTVEPVADKISLASESKVYWF